jgi:hypothetical protein
LKGGDNRTHALSSFADKQVLVVRAYNGVCTPQVFVFNRDRRLRYHGRVDDNRDVTLVRSHDLRNALEAVLDGKQLAVQQTRPFGCSVKWKQTRTVS